MGIIVFVIFGIVIGMIARKLVPSPIPGGLITDCVVGVVGAMLGTWLAKTVFHIHITNQLSSPSTWVSGILGAALLLLAVRTAFGMLGGGGRHIPGLHR
jgi:uncharacterized membrane protein YeaQ/YmgE (transglycosylase-associated protein family)